MTALDPYFNDDAVARWESAAALNDQAAKEAADAEARAKFENAAKVCREQAAKLRDGERS